MYDVVIIGSGAAGLSAALNCKDKKIAVISKTFPTHSQTVQAQGGINAVLYDDNDSIEQHTLDTFIGGKEISSKSNIQELCTNAKETIQWLDKIGVPFNRDEKNKIAQRKFGGTSKIRTCYSSDYTGLKILHTLYDQCIKDDIKFINEHLLLDLIINDNECKAILVLDIKTSQVKTIKAKSFILASGGYAGIYSKNTTNSYANTADGLSIALNNYVELSNMEFIQFHPTTLLNSHILISESARGEGGYLVDEDENRFINELDARDKVARAIVDKYKEGKKVFLDLRHLGKEKILQLMPQERRLALEFSNVKLEDELLPIIPSAHYSMGGIKTDINTKTNIKNLYACGECAQADLHGANRLGGNSLLEIVYMGKKAGLNASKNGTLIDEDFDTLNKENKAIDKIQTILNKENKINLYKEKEKLADIMFDKVGLYRDEETLLEAKNDINILKENFKDIGLDDKSKVFNKNLVEYLEYENMLNISQVIIQTALNRKESRGSHFRSDYPNESNEYKKSSISYKENDTLINIFKEIK